jgi:hypothetical protein
LAKAWRCRIFWGSAQQESASLQRKAKPFAIRDGEHGTGVQLGVEAMPWVMLDSVIAVARGSVAGASLSEFLGMRGHEIMPKGMFHDRRNDYQKA